METNIQGIVLWSFLAFERIPLSLSELAGGVGGIATS
jgi:hypothetical protein